MTKIKVNRILLLFAGCALIYLVTLVLAPYAGQWLVKALPIFILAALAWHALAGQHQILMLAALLCSALGDIFLAPSPFYQFVFGLGAFLLAQIIYCVVFYQLSSIRRKKPWQHLLVLSLLSYSFIMAGYILPETGDLFIPVLIYLTVISAMGILATYSGASRLVLAGALLFIMSDSILAIGLFKSPLLFNDLWVMLTYYAAQGLILSGVIKKQSKRIF